MTNFIKEELEKWNKEFPIHHLECEDCWYSCPKSDEGCCDDNAGKDCNCGAEERRNDFINFITAAHLRLLERVRAKVKEIEPRSGEWSRTWKAGYVTAKEDFINELKSIE